jgi:hypothetical protein
MSATHIDASLEELRGLQARHADLATQIQQLIDRLSNSNAASVYLLPEASIELAAGEIYVGLVLSPDANYHLVLLPGELTDANWNQAREWATSIGGQLPTRQEQALLFANAKTSFQEAWYWSGQEHETEASYAWYCAFYHGGYQSYYRQSYEGRARAVRKVPLSA